LMDWSFEYAAALPFSRTNVAKAIGVPSTKVGNWIDRNSLWQTPRHGYYRLQDVFDLAGFAALRTAHMPEKDCARYVCNYGFYRSFLAGDQLNKFSFRNGKWDIGIFDPSALISLVVNMRIAGTDIFSRIAEETSAHPGQWAEGFFESFRKLYLKALELDRIDRGSVELFEFGAR